MTITTASNKPIQSRMGLKSIIKGKVTEPITVLLYGTEGIGKSTFGAEAPASIFIDGERGSSELDVSRFPVPETWEDTRDAVRTLINDNHEYKTLVLDTLDWLEPMLWSFICRRDNKENIEAYGYKAGYVVAVDEWRSFLADLERLKISKKMNIILLAHSWIKTFKDPESEGYDRYEMKLHPKTASLFKEWAKAILFANYESMAVKDKATKRTRGISTGARWLYATRTAAYDAKNRYGLPEQLPFSWADFQQALEEKQDLAKLREVILRKASALGEEVLKQTEGALTRAGEDSGKLTQLNNWLNCKQPDEKKGE